MDRTATSSSQSFQPPASVEAQAPLIMVIDADESARSVLAVAMGREGFLTVTAADALEAVKLVGPGYTVPQLIACSPGGRMDESLSLVSQLRSESRTEAIPVLLIGDGDETQFQDLSRAVGVNEIVRKPAYARDVVALARLQLAPHGQAGDRLLYADQVPVAGLLRALLATPRSGVIELEDGRGRIAFRQGQVLDAKFDNLHGVHALVRGLILARGEYRVFARALSFDAAFHFTLREFATLVTPRLKRWESRHPRSLPLDATLAVDFSALSKALPSMPDAVNGVVRLFDGRRDVREVLMDSPLDETVSLDVATRLYSMGVVVPQNSVRQDEELFLRSSPALFEPKEKPAEAIAQMEQLFAGAPVALPPENEAAATLDRDWAAEVPPATSEGQEAWAVARIEELEPGLKQQLAAFNIQAVVETPAVESEELRRFNQGQTTDEQPLEAALGAPIRLLNEVTPQIIPEAELPIVPGVEGAADDGFAEHSVTAEQWVPTDESVAASAVAPPVPRTEDLEEAFFRQPESVTSVPAVAPVRVAPAAYRQSSFWLGWGSVAGLVAVATIAAWKMSSNRTEAPVVAPVIAEAPKVEPVVAKPAPAAPAPELQAEPVAEAVEVVPPPERVVEEEAPVPIDTRVELAKAVKLYDQGKLPKAIALLEEIVAQDPSSTQAWLQLGLARYDSGNAAGAEDAAHTVLALDERVVQAHLLLATVQLNSSRRAEATVELKKALELEPTGPNAEEARALLKHSK